MDPSEGDRARHGTRSDGLSRSRAERLDRLDPLAAARAAFFGDDASRVYLDGNSLGRLPEATRRRLARAIDEEWGRDLVASWGRGWFEAPLRIGDRIAPLIGATAGEVAVSDSTTVNLYKLAGAALAGRPERPKLVSDAMNFPSDLYTLESAVRSVGGNARLEVVSAPVAAVEPDMDALAAAIDDRTALVVLSLVTFKSGYLHDARRLAERARRVGAWLLWDLSHAAGAVPVHLDDWGTELAVGCTYKYLNGGPGAPAFLYVRRDLQSRLRSPVEGWFGRAAPFGFDLAFEPAAGIARFLVGTPPILSLLAVEAGLDPLERAGLGPLRAKSEALTSYLIELADARLSSRGFELGTPRDGARRGSHVSLRHPDAYRINRALIDRGVVPDFREPDTIRLGLAPLYNGFADVWDAVDRLVAIVDEGAHLVFDVQRSTVT